MIAELTAFDFGHDLLGVRGPAKDNEQKSVGVAKDAQLLHLLLVGLLLAWTPDRWVLGGEVAQPFVEADNVAVEGGQAGAALLLRAAVQRDGVGMGVVWAMSVRSVA